MKRRSFFSCFFGMLASLPALAQKAAPQGEKTIVCEDTVLICPNGHKTCPSINGTLVLGEDRNVDNPAYAELRDYHLERCNVCKVAFFRE